MKRLILTSIFCSLLLGAWVGDTEARDEASFDKLGGEILGAFQEFYPVLATEMGVHRYDDRLTDYSSGSVRDMRNRLTDFTKELYKYRNFKFSPAKSIDFRLIRSNVEAALLELREIDLYTRAPYLYVDDAVDGVYFLLLSQHAPMEVKLPAILARMEAVPKLFDQARDNLKKPPPLWIDLATENLESGQQFYRQVGAELMRQFPDQADEILRTVTRAREAMTDFSVYLSEIQPGPQGSFALGRKNYDYLLQHYYFLDFDSDSLLRLGENLLASADSVYRDYRHYVEENHQTGQDSVFVPDCFSRDDVLEYYQWEVAQLRTFLEANEILTVPDDIAPVKIVETPHFLRSMVGGIAYQPAGPFDSVQTGLFYVRPVPEDLDSAQLDARYRYVHRRGFKGSVVHEAYPGHHLQLQIAGRHPSDIRKWQLNPLAVEGWALYCEEMMLESGLYDPGDAAQKLAVLGGIRFRAARIVADVKLHTGQFSYQECVEWMCDVLEAETESARSYHRTMVRKYTTRPGYYMSYLVGKRALARLRDDYARRAGEDFDEAEFYDRLLTEGAIPPALIREALGL